MNYTTYQSPIGTLYIASDNGEVINGLWFEAQTHFPDIRNWTKCHMPIFSKTTQWLYNYFKGNKQPMPTPPLSPNGTEFQQKVWQQLLQIPFGQITTYGAIAKAVDCKSAQAVGQAVGRNPICIMIPCHRVMGTNNKLTGYAGGPTRKLWLLTHERSNAL